MINKLPADDLFEKSSMTFGEHLDELRRALVKALIWLGIGTAFGLLLAERIVKFIETPLKAAITGYYVERAKVAFEEANGAKASDELALFMARNNLQPYLTYIDPRTLSEASTELIPVESIEPSSTSQNPQQAEEKSGSLSAGSTSTAQAESQVLDQNPWNKLSLERLQHLRPLVTWQPIPNKLIALTSVEPFMMWLKAGLLAGVVIGAPGIFWHIWQFLAAGLYPHERRYVYWYLPLSLGLFFAGVALAFFVIFKMVLQFLIGYSSSLDVEFSPRLNDYMSFAMMLPLGFGLAFQLPIVMLALHRFGVVPAELFLAQWRVAVLVLAFLSRILTPADPYSMIGLLIPLVALYFLGILLCHYMPRGAGLGSPALDP